MRISIRLLTATTLVLFVVAIAVAQHGEQARAIGTSRNIPGLFEFFVLGALLTHMVLLFLITSILGLALATRTKERPWVIAIALSVMGNALIYLGLFLPQGFLLPVIQPFLPHSSFLTLLLVCIPALLGDVFLTMYSLRTPPDPRPPLYMRLGG
jgi:hypothetical protein